MITPKKRMAFAAVAVIATGAVVFISWPHFSYWTLTGSWSPVKTIEQLPASIGVRSWSGNGLLLADGRTVQLSGFRKLPDTSNVLSEATKRGVEVDSNGRVFGLIRVHHWCGNDPVEEHIARVDLSLMLIFLQEGDLLIPLSEDEKKLIPAHSSDGFSKYGWRVEEFGRFKVWCDYSAPTNL